MGYDLSPASRATMLSGYRSALGERCSLIDTSPERSLLAGTMWGLKSLTDGIRLLTPEGQFTTTIDQVALAFTAPANLPPAGVYEQAIQAELENLRNADG